MLRLAALGLAVLLAGCSSLATNAEKASRGLDIQTDDLSTMIVVFDVPYGLEPVEKTSILTYDAGPAQGGRHMKLALVHADAGDIAGTLPPPSAQRTYYLFGLTDVDKGALREAQYWTRTGDMTPTLTLLPQFCTTAPVNASAVSVSALTALPSGASIKPLIDHQVLATLAPDLAACS